MHSGADMVKRIRHFTPMIACEMERSRKVNGTKNGTWVHMSYGLNSLMGDSVGDYYRGY